MSKTHLNIGNGMVACGAESSWRTRGHSALDLPRANDTQSVTCKRCRNSYSFYLKEK